MAIIIPARALHKALALERDAVSVRAIAWWAAPALGQADAP